MKEIIHIPWYKRIFIFSGLFAYLGFVSISLTSGFDKYDVIYPLGFLLFVLFGFTFPGKLRIGESGISALSSKGETFAHIPWTDILCCKVYPNYSKFDPQFCVCYKDSSMLTPIEAIHMKNGQPIMDAKSHGHVLCDFDLRKLCFGRMTPETFAEKDVFAFLVNDAQSEQVKLWWSQANEGRLADPETQAQ